MQCLAYFIRTKLFKTVYIYEKSIFIQCTQGINVSAKITSCWGNIPILIQESSKPTYISNNSINISITCFRSIYYSYANR